MNILVSGSLAYDRIMDFPGKFSEHILPEKIHILNVCFLVNGLEEKFGGTAGNIAYSLTMLEEKPLILSAVGKDFARYQKRLEKLGLSLDGVRRIEDEFTAGAYITTDQSDNQITGFNPGAMKHTCGFDVSRVDPSDTLAVIAPGNVDDMVGLAQAYRERKVPYIFDPGQQITAMNGQQLLEALSGAAILISNDYELEMIKKATGQERDALLEQVGAIITTLAENGCRLVEKSGETEIPAVAVEKALDPTGAGDAFRAGLLKGMATGRGLVDACRMGATVASYCVELYGTQEHSFDQASFDERYSKTYGG